MFRIPDDVYTDREKRLIAGDDLYLARIIACHRLRDEGYSLRQIGTALGISHERVRQLLRASAVNY